MPQRFGYTVALRNVWLWTLPMAAYSSLTLFKTHAPFKYVPDLPIGMEAALTFAMGMLLAFRVNRAYERWWEARTLWGSLVNISRNLAVKTRQLVAVDEQERTEMRRLIVGFCYALKDHLRDESRLQDVPGFAGCDDQPEHVPSFIMQNVYAQFNKWLKEDRIQSAQLWVLDSEARQFLDVCGACERIKSTLMSVSWRALTWQCLAAYLLVMPWALVDEFGAWTIPLSAAIAYFVIGGEGIAHYVEEPFGRHEDHLDLDSICVTIDNSVSEILAERTG